MTEAPDLLTPAVEEKLEALGIALPQEIPQEEIEAAVGASPDVAEWLNIPDDCLRLVVEQKGYAMVPIADVGIDREGRVCDTRVKAIEGDHPKGSIFHGVTCDFDVEYEPLPPVSNEPRTSRPVPPVEDFDPAPVSTGNPKDLLGMKKPNVSLVPPASSLYQAQAMMDGAAKYGPYNWRGNPVKAMVYISAALRHIFAYLDGENIDPVSGVPHIGHGLACLGIIADATETGNLLDDRPSTGPAGDMVRRFNDSQSFKR